MEIKNYSTKENFQELVAELAPKAAKRITSGNNKDLLFEVAITGMLLTFGIELSNAIYGED